ncbi:methyltransferase [Nocardia arthritidis]|nr:methyltransferase [Nocardia arthritidis]
MPDKSPSPEEFSPGALMGMIMGYSTAQYIRAFAQLRLADLLASGPRTSTDLVTELGANHDGLTRYLRACVTVGLVREENAETFRVTALGEQLRTGTKFHSLARAYPGPQNYLPYARIAETVMTGKPAAEAALGAGFWAYLDANPEESRYFGELMSFMSANSGTALADNFDLGRFNRIVDIGGSHGVMLSQLLEAAPHANGVLHDLPEVLPHARTYLDGKGMTDRVELVGGSFFEEVPPDGDLYILKSVLCDWDDERAAKILAAIADATKPGATLLVIDSVLPDEPHRDSPDDRFDAMAMMNFGVLLLVGGKVRTPSEFRELVTAAGFEVRQIRTIPDGPSGWNLVEAVRV